MTTNGQSKAMLKGEQLGAAIKAAIELKGVSQAEVARHFKIKPPSISDWIKRGTIGKDKLPELFRYFGDVTTPAHWGLSTSFVAEEPHGKPYLSKRSVGPREDPIIQQVVALMEATDQIGRAMALAAVKVALDGHRPAKANSAS